MQNTHRPTRNFNTSASTMLVAALTIAESAATHQADFANEDTTYTRGHLEELHQRIDNAARNILGADNAAALRQNTDRLEAVQADAHHKLGLTKILIEAKYNTDPLRRDELLNTLGFRAYYAPSAKNQGAMGQLLSRFTENLTPAIEDELIVKGLPPARIDALREYANTFIPLSASQEGQKGTRTELTAADVLALNGIHAEVIALCKLGQRIFKGNTALRARFVYDKIAAQQSAYHSGGSGTPVAPATV